MSLSTSRYVSGVACLIYISARDDGDVGVDFINSCCLNNPASECVVVAEVDVIQSNGEMKELKREKRDFHKYCECKRENVISLLPFFLSIKHKVGQNIETRTSHWGLSVTINSVPNFFLFDYKKEYAKRIQKVIASKREGESTIEWVNVRRKSADERRQIHFAFY